MSAAAQTSWAELIAATLADAGITLCVISPGSRSTPLVVALAREPRLELVTIIDERAAAFFALGAARATGSPAVLVCTSGSAAAHYLPAIVEASMAGIPLIALTANRPPELHDCGASQTIDQRGLYGGFVRCALDLGAPVTGELALRAVRRKLVQAVTLALGPAPGPVHVDVPLRKPLEPAAPSTDDERALARFVASLRDHPVLVAPPHLAPDPQAIEAIARSIEREPRGVIVVGAMPVSFARSRERVFELARLAGYPIIAETGSQLRLGPRPEGIVAIDHFDLIPLARLPEPGLVIQLGAEPVAAGWPTWLASTRPSRCVLAGSSWCDPDSSAEHVLLGERELVLGAITKLLASSETRTFATARSELQTNELAMAETARAATRRHVEHAAASEAWLHAWRSGEDHAAIAIADALAAHPRCEGAVIRAAIDALPDDAIVQIGNSLPIRVVDHVSSGGVARPVITQRGAAGIDGLVASAAGATRAGHPVLLVLGDVSFAHDLGGLLATRAAAAPLAILVIDNGGGQIFAGLPVARAELAGAFARHWLTVPELDPAAVAAVLGARAITAASAATAASAVATALATPGVTVIHAAVSTSGAHDARRAAIELYAHAAPNPVLAKLGGSHDC